MYICIYMYMRTDISFKTRFIVAWKKEVWVCVREREKEREQA